MRSANNFCNEHLTKQTVIEMATMCKNTKDKGLSCLQRNMDHYAWENFVLQTRLTMDDKKIVAQIHEWREVLSSFRVKLLTINWLDMLLQL